MEMITIYTTINLNTLIKLKKNIFPIFICLFIILLLLFSKSCLVASKNGMILWATCIVPSLFPFFVATDLLNQTKVPALFGKVFSKFMKPIFNVPGEGSYAFIMGIICGYPTGAKIISDFYSKKICTKSESERMLAFTNNSGPLFILGTVGISFFANTEIGILLLITHLLSAISVGILFGFISRFLLNNKNTVSNSVSIKQTKHITNIGTSLNYSIISSIKTLFIIGGFIILFSVILSIFNKLDLFKIPTYFGIPFKYSEAFFSGILELTNGLSLTSSIITKNISINIIICAFLLGFGGLSVLLQVYSICSQSNLSIKWYFFGKILQGFICAIYTLCFIKIFTFLNFDL